MIDESGRIVLVNREIERLFGYPRSELLGKPVEMLLPVELREDHSRERAAFLRAPSMRTMGAGRELFGLTSTGERIPLEIGLTPVATDEGLFVLSSVVDVSPRKRAEARFREAVESSPNGMLMIDHAGNIVLVNREIERMFGYVRKQLLGSKVEMLLPERFRAAHPASRDAFFAEPEKRLMGEGRELHGLRSDGSEFPVEIGLNPIETDDGLFVLGSVVDISARKRAEDERRELEARLRQSQKLEAIGTLAGGIAHDFNNILGTIQGYAELLERSGRLATPDLADLMEVIKASERGRTLVQQILTFSRRQEPTRKPLKLDRVVGDVGKLLRATLPSTVEVRIRAEERTPTILGDENAVHQVLMNLASNAAHAMPGGGLMEIVTDGVYLSDSFVRSHPGLHEGHYSRITVRDEGVGMEESVLQRAFEPFFSTKEPGKGTGLGLPIVHAIVRDHGGMVSLESRPQVGTVVRCYFPAALAEVELATPSTAELPRGNGERILVVDDEPALARLGQRRLVDLGYRVTLVSDSEAALERLRQSQDGFDLLVTDYYMPKHSGLDLARQVAAFGAGTGILMVTGVLSGLPDAELKAAGVDRVLAKPVTTAQLAQAVRDVLLQRKRAR
jgi:PAS domain S-box-containing protein